MICKGKSYVTKIIKKKVTYEKDDLQKMLCKKLGLRYSK